MNYREEAERLVRNWAKPRRRNAVLNRLRFMHGVQSAAVAVQMTLIMLDDLEMVADGVLPAFLEALEASHV